MFHDKAYIYCLLYFCFQIIQSKNVNVFKKGKYYLKPTKNINNVFIFWAFTGLVLFFDYFYWNFKICLNNPSFFYQWMVPVLSYLLYKDLNKQIPFRYKSEFSLNDVFNRYLYLAFILILAGFYFKNNICKSIALPVYVYGFVKCFVVNAHVNKLFFPSGFLIFFYPFEWALSRWIPLLNTLNVRGVVFFLEKTGFEVTYSLEDFCLTIENFTMFIIPSCSGLDWMIVLIIFSMIYIWKSPVFYRHKGIFILSIPFIIYISNILRISFLTIAGIFGWNFFFKEPFHSFPAFLSLILILGLLKMEIKLFKGLVITRS